MSSSSLPSSEANDDCEKLEPLSPLPDVCAQTKTTAVPAEMKPLFIICTHKNTDRPNTRQSYKPGRARVAGAGIILNYQLDGDTYTTTRRRDTIHEHDTQTRHDTRTRHSTQRVEFVFAECQRAVCERSAVLGAVGSEFPDLIARRRRG